MGASTARNKARPFPSTATYSHLAGLRSYARINSPSTHFTGLTSCLAAYSVCSHPSASLNYFYDGQRCAMTPCHHLNIFTTPLVPFAKVHGPTATRHISAASSTGPSLLDHPPWPRHLQTPPERAGLQNVFFPYPPNHGCKSTQGAATQAPPGLGAFQARRRLRFRRGLARGPLRSKSQHITGAAAWSTARSSKRAGCPPTASARASPLGPCA